MTGFWLCPACIGMHIAQVAEASWLSNVIQNTTKIDTFTSITFYLSTPRQQTQVQYCLAWEV
jgi:hypothetical protein